MFYISEYLELSHTFATNMHRLWIGVCRQQIICSNMCLQNNKASHFSLLFILSPTHTSDTLTWYSGYQWTWTCKLMRLETHVYSVPLISCCVSVRRVSMERVRAHTKPTLHMRLTASSTLRRFAVKVYFFLQIHRIKTVHLQVTFFL